MVSVGDRRLFTATIENNLDPVWNSDELSLRLGGAEEPLTLEVFDSDLLTFDDSLGKAVVDVGTLAYSKWHKCKQSLGYGKGEIEFKVRLEKQAKLRLQKVQHAREELAKEQAEQLKLAKAKVAEGAGDVLTVAVVAATGLKNTDRGLFRRSGDCSDPYVMVSAGNKKLRTKTINNNLNPAWNSEWFSFSLGDADQSLELEVFDSDLLTFDDLLGKAKIDLASLAAGKWIECKQSLGDGNGEIELKMRLERQGGTRRQKADAAREKLEKQQAAELQAAKAKAAEGAGDIMTIVVARANGLKNTDRGVFRRSGDASDPYVVVSVGKQKLRTAVIDNNLNPVWNSQEFSFTLAGGEKSLALEAFDSDWLTFDDSLGKAQVDIGTLAAGKWTEMKQSLGDGNGEIEFKVRLEKQGKLRMDKAQHAREQLEKEQAEQMRLAKAKAEQGAGDILTVAVLSASDLRNTDRGFFRRGGDASDPYVIVSAGGKKLRTSTIDNNLNPVWNSEWFSFTLGDADRSLELDVFDSDLLTFDDLLGKTKIDVGTLEAGKWLHRKESLGNGSGNIEFKVRLEKQSSVRREKATCAYDQLEKQQKEQSKLAKAKAEEGAADILTVAVLGATGLKNTDRGLFRRGGDASDPYVEVSAGKQKFRTATIDDNLNPVWNSQEFEFTLASGEKSLQLKVFDSDLLTFDDLLGEVRVDVGSIDTGAWIQQWQSLGEGNGKIEFRMRLERQGSQRQEKAKRACEKLREEQAEQVRLAKAKAANGAGDIVTVAVVSATGLRNTDRGLFRRSGDASDPYVVVSAGEKKLRTSTIDNDLNPIWNSEWFSFSLGAGDRSVKLQVFDSDLLTFDDLLGEASLAVETLTPGQWHQCRESLGPGNGELEFQVRLEKQQSSRLGKADVAVEKLEKQQLDQLQAVKAKAKKGAGRVLSVVVIAAAGLRNTDRGLFRRSGDMSDPYAIVSVGKSKFWTATVDNDLNPAWNSKEFSFPLGDADNTLRLEVFDRDWLTFDDMLGKVEVDIRGIDIGKWLTRKESLGDGNGEIEFKVRLEQQESLRMERALSTGEKLRQELELELSAAKSSAEAGAGKVLTVKVLSAHDLANTEGRLAKMLGDASDPFVVVTVGEEKLQTRIVWNDLNPVWAGDAFSFTTDAPNAQILFEVFDFDWITQNDLLGKITINVEDIKPGEWVDFRQVLAEQPENGKGELAFQVRVELQEKNRTQKADEARLLLAKQQAEELEQQKREHKEKEAA